MFLRNMCKLASQNSEPAKEMKIRTYFIQHSLRARSYCIPALCACISTSIQHFYACISIVHFYCALLSIGLLSIGLLSLRLYGIRISTHTHICTHTHMHTHTHTTTMHLSLPHTHTIMHLNLPHTHTTGPSWGAQNASKIDSTIKQICRHHLWIHVCFALFWCGVEDFIPPSRPQGVRIVKNES